MNRKNKRKKGKEKQSSHVSRGCMLLSEDSPFAVKEAYIRLRTNLMFCMTGDRERNCKVFAVTSANPSEGKSLSAANIAISFAMLGKKTLLLDADVRKPIQHKLWRIGKNSGICDFLAELGSCARYEVRGLPLSVICAGTTPPNPTELLASQRMKTLIAHLRGQYEYIILDTPPVNVVADAQIISTYVDGFVLVVRSGKTESLDLAGAVDTLRRADGNICGVLLNRLDPREQKNSHGYKSYGYGYGKSYEYAEYYGK